MAVQRSFPNTFHLIGNKFNHYFDPNHFMGQDALSNVWDSKSKNHIQIKTNDKEFELAIDLPGFDQENIKVENDSNRITITAKYSKSELDMDSNDDVGYYEKSDFEEVFQLPDNLNIKKIRHHFDGKILTVSVPYSLAEKLE